MSVSGQDLTTNFRNYCNNYSRRIMWRIISTHNPILQCLGTGDWKQLVGRLQVT